MPQQCCNAVLSLKLSLRIVSCNIALKVVETMLQALKTVSSQCCSGFCFLVQIRAFVIQTSLGLQNLNMKGKTKRILVVVVK